MPSTQLHWWYCGRDFQATQVRRQVLFQFALSSVTDSRIKLATPAQLLVLETHLRTSFVDGYARQRWCVLDLSLGHLLVEWLRRVHQGGWCVRVLAREAQPRAQAF